MLKIKNKKIKSPLHKLVIGHENGQDKGRNIVDINKSKQISMDMWWIQNNQIPGSWRAQYSQKTSILIFKY